MKKKLIILLLASMGLTGILNADTSTTRIGLTKPSIGSSGWGVKWNANADLIDSNVAVLNANNTFSGSNTFTATNTFSGANTFSAVQTFSTYTWIAIGSVGNPGLSFATDTDSGLMLAGANVPAIVAGGVEVAEFATTSITPGANNTFALGSTSLGWTRLFMMNGSIAAPSYTFRDDDDNGFSRATTNVWNASAGGVSVTTFTSTGVSWLGTTTNDSAATGWVGEYKSSSTANMNVGATGTYYDVAAVTLTPGDWDLEGIQEVTANGATFSSTLLEFGIGTTTGNSATGMTLGVNYQYQQSVLPTNFTAHSMILPRYRVSISAQTTYYLKGYVSAYSVAVPKVWGTITARRVR